MALLTEQQQAFLVQVAGAKPSPADPAAAQASPAAAAAAAKGGAPAAAGAAAPPATPGKAPAVTPTRAVSTAGKPKQAADLAAALAARGLSEKAQANILANIEAESNFTPRAEELDKYSAKTLFRMFGEKGVAGGQPASGKNKVRFKTLKDAEDTVKAGAEAVGNILYGGRMGNADDEGYKYRGRSVVQITGKENYKKIGDKIGKDLVKEPDLADSADLQGAIVAAYFELFAKSTADLDDIDKVTALVGPADEASVNRRKELAKHYTPQAPDAGAQPASGPGGP